MELCEGDIISLVDNGDVPQEDRPSVKKFEYELCYTAGIEGGEILVQTTTEPIVIDDSDDEIDEKPPQHKNEPVQMEVAVDNKVESFRDDYEAGEPSGIVLPPPPPPKKNDPVSKVGACLVN